MGKSPLELEKTIQSYFPSGICGLTVTTSPAWASGPHPLLQGHLRGLRAHQEQQQRLERQLPLTGQHARPRVRCRLAVLA